MTAMDCIAKGAEAEAAGTRSWTRQGEARGGFRGAQLHHDRELPAGWADALPDFTPEDSGVATRIHSQTMLNALGSAIPGFVGGSISRFSNMTLMKQFGYHPRRAQHPLRRARARHGRHRQRHRAPLARLQVLLRHLLHLLGLHAFAMRIGQRFSGAPTLFVDDDPLHRRPGEDGSTHQPIEHLASFRAMPGMLMMRPADGNETAGAYKIAVEQTDRPTTFALSRQVVPNLAGTSKEGVTKGAYVVAGPAAGEDATASSSAPAPSSRSRSRLLRARRQGARRLHALLELFEEQSDEYKESILPSRARRSSPSRRAPPSAGAGTRTSPSAATRLRRLRARRHPVQGVRHHLRGCCCRRQVPHVRRFERLTALERISMGRADAPSFIMRRRDNAGGCCKEFDTK